MKLHYSNIELWFLDTDRNVTSDELDDACFLLAKQDIEKASAASATGIVFLLVLDGLVYKNNSRFKNLLLKIQECCDKNNISEIYLLAGMAAENTSTLDLDNTRFKFVDYEYAINAVNKAYSLPNRNQKWNKDTERFLFLTGKPSRHNRITLLYKLYQKGLLKNADYSFFAPMPSEYEWCRLATGLDKHTFDLFVENNIRALDKKYEDGRSYTYSTGKVIKEKNLFGTDLAKDFIYVDYNYYKNTSFSIVSEGHPDNEKDFSSFLTEKFYRTVINKHPFIFASTPDMYEYVKQKGFRTFEKYLAVPEYGTIENYKDRLDAITENANHWIKNIHKFVEINDDIEYNYNLLLSKHEKIISTKNFLVEQGADEVETDYYLNHVGMDRIVRVVHNTLKEKK